MHRLLAFSSVAYPIALASVWLALRFIGERYWLTTVAIYLPLVVLAVPLPFLVLALIITKKLRLLALQTASMVILLFPLLGLSLNLPSARETHESLLRIVSYNVNSAHGGTANVVRELTSPSPDLIFVQELPDYAGAGVKEALSKSYPHVSYEGELLVASRFPIAAVEVPPQLPFYGRLRSPRFMRVVIDTNIGRITFFHVHPVSPRGGFYELRGDGLRREILTGRLFTGARARGVQDLAALRWLQIETLAHMARAEQGPVVIVGDTNSPNLSYVRRRYLGEFRDGFAEAGFGFGNTFPAKRPWMRIDLVLSSRHLRFTDFEVGQSQVSDHLSVRADLAREQAREQVREQVPEAAE